MADGSPKISKDAESLELQEPLDAESDAFASEASPANRLMQRFLLASIAAALAASAYKEYFSDKDHENFITEAVLFEQDFFRASSLFKTTDKGKDCYAALPEQQYTFSYLTQDGKEFLQHFNHMAVAPTVCNVQISYDTPGTGLKMLYTRATEWPISDREAVVRRVEMQNEKIKADLRDYISEYEAAREADNIYPRSQFVTSVFFDELNPRSRPLEPNS